MHTFRNLALLVLGVVVGVNGHTAAAPPVPVAGSTGDGGGE